MSDKDKIQARNFMRKYGRVQTRFRVNYKKGMTAKVKKTIINLMIPSVDKGIVGGFYIMFFIGGVGQGSKILDISKILTCKFCGSQAGCQIVMTYYYFSFFFIPLFLFGFLSQFSRIHRFSALIKSRER